jgi:predicted flavoprotein YhiN
MPFIKKDTILFLKNIDKNYTIYDLLSRIINEKLAKVIIDSSNIKRNVLFKNLSNKELAKLTNNIRNYKVHITKTKDFNDSQVTIGGVNLTEVESNTFESLKVKNLYIIGEVLDLDADCGGYNLTIAFLSAIKAARGINND